MAETDLQNILLPWTQSGQDAERKRTKQLEKSIDHLRELKSTAFSRIEKGGNITTLKKEWQEAWTYQLQVTGKLVSTTMTFSGYIMGQAITADLMRQAITPNLILERPSDGLQVKVSATQADTDYDNLTAVVAAHGNSGALSNDTSAVTWFIVGNAYSDYDETWSPQSLDRDFRSCGTQRVKFFFETPWLTKAVSMENIPDNLGYQVKEIMTKANRLISRMILRSRPVYSGGQYIDGFSTANSTCKGVYFWREQVNGEYAVASCYVNKSSVALDDDDLNALAFGLMYDENADFNVGDWVILVDPTTSQFIHEFGRDERLWYMNENKYGYKVTNFRSKVGKDFEILVDPHAKPGTASMVDLSAFSWGWVKGENLRTVEIAQSVACVDKLMITGVMWATMVRSPRQKIGTIYGLPTTYA